MTDRRHEMNPAPARSKTIRLLDWLFAVAAFVLLILFTTRYLMPFRMDDILHMDWAKHHTFFGAWDPVHGSIVRSFRPIFAATIWLLTHTAGTEHYMPWHIVLVGSFLIALAYAGRTARYLSGRPAALYFTVGLYWIAFLPILNVLFWYGDLTFTLELLFITPAWYYGVRGLLEGRTGLMAIAITSGILAVMTKEPAIVLVHGVLLGTLVLRWSEVVATWKKRSTASRISVVSSYLLFIGVTVFIYLASPTKDNRFLSPNSPLLDQMLVRQEYYDSVLLRMLPRLLLFAPIFYGLLASTKQVAKSKREEIFQLVFLLILSFVLAAFCTTILQLAIALLVLFGFAIVRSKRRNALLLQLPFLLCALITMAAILVTKMVVKTQLTELAILFLVLSGIAWSGLINDLLSALGDFIKRPVVRKYLVAFSVLAGVAGLVELYPTTAHQEELLRGVRDVRSNANDAVKWAAKHLPKGATLAQPDYGLYGIKEGQDLTTTSDANKVEAQYPFPGGYIFYYFPLLNRSDLKELHLGDSTKLSDQLDSLRHQARSYLFLQSELDYRKFHSQSPESLLDPTKDSLMQGFYRGGYHSEIWRLGQ